MLKLCVNGLWEEVVIDDYLPCNADGQLRFCKNSPVGPEGDAKGVIWGPLVEKAWAKLNGCYKKIQDGALDEGFIHLCGVPSVSYKHLEYKGKDALIWNALLNGQRDKHLMTAGTTDDQK